MESAGVMIVEDSWFLAAQIQSWLEEERIAVVGAAASVGAGIALADATTPQFAIVDYNLRGQPARPLIAHLNGLNVKVIVVTGYSDVGELPGVVRVIEKPCARRELLEALRGAGLTR